MLPGSWDRQPVFQTQVCYTLLLAHPHHRTTCTFFSATTAALSLQRARYTTLNWPWPIFFSTAMFFRVQYWLSGCAGATVACPGTNMACGIMANCADAPAASCGCSGTNCVCGAALPAAVVLSPAPHSIGSTVGAAI